MNGAPSIAYFSMEIALDPGVPTYAGGLGVLAGDTIRAAADMGVPMVAVTLVHRKGYFFQRLDPSGWQTEEIVAWSLDNFLEELPERVQVTVDGHSVHVRAWRYTVKSPDGGSVPVILLDTDVPENEPWHRGLTDKLYGGDHYYRLCQEIVLGRGGVRMLRALRYVDCCRFHMNEGHASLLAIELLEEERLRAGRDRVEQEDVEAVRRQCVFTTHTPVEAGHDKFPLDLATRVIGLRSDLLELGDLICSGNELNMTYLALNLSHYVNGVAKKHGEISRKMFTGFKIDAITNGVHASTWISAPFQEIFDTHLKGWRQDNFSLRAALSIPREEIWRAHLEAKSELISFVNEECNAGFDHDHLTLGFARRAAPYKRGALPLHDLERIKAIVEKVGPIQFVYAGKAHPGDENGKAIIQRIFQAKEALAGSVEIAYVPNYDLRAAKLLTSGVDLWLNTPQPPMEASGTSGMKAALNGIPSMSVLDGWWIEGWVEGVTGWAIGDMPTGDEQGRDRWISDADSFYDKLEHGVAPLYYNDRDRFIDIMRHCIAINGSFFNTQRMLQQYVLKAYFGATEQNNQSGD